MQQSINLRFLKRGGRFVRFGLVGLSGVVVNTAVLWALVQGVRLPVILASVCATEIAILSNFWLNDQWTFRTTLQQSSVIRRLLRFNGVALVGLVITAALLLALTTYVGLPLLLANGIAVIGAMGWNYILSTRWAWRSAPQQQIGD